MVFCEKKLAACVNGRFIAFSRFSITLLPFKPPKKAFEISQESKEFSMKLNPAQGKGILG
jgi:hypothetical protein